MSASDLSYIGHFQWPYNLPWDADFAELAPIETDLSTAWHWAWRVRYWRLQVAVSWSITTTITPGVGDPYDIVDEYTLTIDRTFDQAADSTEVGLTAPPSRMREIARIGGKAGYYHRFGYIFPGSAIQIEDAYRWRRTDHSSDPATVTDTFHDPYIRFALFSYEGASPVVWKTVAGALRVPCDLGIGPYGFLPGGGPLSIYRAESPSRPANRSGTVDGIAVPLWTNAPAEATFSLSLDPAGDWAS